MRTVRNVMRAPINLHEFASAQKSMSEPNAKKHNPRHVHSHTIKKQQALHLSATDTFGETCLPCLTVQPLRMQHHHHPMNWLVAKNCFVPFLLFAILIQTTKGCECNCSEYKGTIDLDFNPAFLSVAEFDGDPAGLSLYVTSFFNVEYKERIFPFNLFLGLAIVSFERDLVARIPEIDQVVQADAYESAEVEELTDLDPFSFLFFGPYYKTEWPNDAIKVPQGVFPFQALLVPQGFLVDPQPGRLSVINMDDPDRREFVRNSSSLATITKLSFTT